MLILFICAVSSGLYVHAQQSAWDALKPEIAPELTPAYTGIYNTPQPLPLADYGWEDGLQVSFDGLHLYTLYAPADLLSWVGYFVSNPGLPICESLGSGKFIRPYAGDYGMDMHTNIFDCDTFMNLDILHAERASLDLPFTDWTLSNIARPGTIEGGPYPIFNSDNPDLIDHFLFTGPGDIWMINNTTANPDNIESAVRLPNPINPLTNEFTADNPMMRRLGGDSLLLIYEKYTDPEFRDFMYSVSDDDGISWSTPQIITTINNDAGHIEHPMLYFDGDAMWMYYSRNFDIYASKQLIPGNWDSWGEERAIILKGNAVGIGEPSLSANGDLYFVTVMQNPDNPLDAADADPWMAKIITPNSIASSPTLTFSISPNPATDFCVINLPVADTYTLTVYALDGRLIEYQQFTGMTYNLSVEDFSAGIYQICICSTGGMTAQAKCIRQ